MCRKGGMDIQYCIFGEYMQFKNGKLVWDRKRGWQIIYDLNQADSLDQDRATPGEPRTMKMIFQATMRLQLRIRRATTSRTASICPRIMFTRNGVEVVVTRKLGTAATVELTRSVIAPA